MIEKLLEFHKNLLNDKEYVSSDETPNKSESDCKQSDADSKKTAKKGKGKKKMAKKSKKQEAKLNETFSMDEEEAEEPKIEAPAPEPEKPAKRKRGKRNPSQKDENKEPEEAKVDPNIENNMTDISMPSEEEAKMQEPPKKKVKGRARKTSKKDTDSKEEPAVEQKEEPKLKRTLRSSLNNVETKEVVKQTKEEPERESDIKEQTKEESERESDIKEKEQAPQKRTRSSRGSVSLQESEPEKPPVNKRLKKSSSFTVSPSIPNNESQIVSKTEEKRKTPLQAKQSRLPRKSISFNTPAKPVATPASVKKQPPTSIPKPKVKGPPNFAELHQKQFDKMQSVDDYLEKKRARTEAAKTPAKAPLTVAANQKTPSVSASTKTPGKDIKFNFVSGEYNSYAKCIGRVITSIANESHTNAGLQKPVFTAKGQVASEKQRVMATVKENVLNSSSIRGSLLNVSRDLNASKMSVNGEGFLKGVRTNRRFRKILKFQHLKEFTSNV